MELTIAHIIAAGGMLITCIVFLWKINHTNQTENNNATRSELDTVRNAREKDIVELRHLTGKVERLQGELTGHMAGVNQISEDVLAKVEAIAMYKNARDYDSKNENH